MKIKTILLALCILGMILPLTQFLPWVVNNGLNATLFIQELFSTKIGAFFGIDVIISAIVLFVFIFTEGKRLKIQNLWFPVVGTLLIGVSFGLPLFLYMRQIQLEKQAKQEHQIVRYRSLGPP